MWGHFLRDVILCGARSWWGSAATHGVPLSPGSCGSPPAHYTSLPSQPIALFLASNEAINELYRSPKLSLELDG